jgi:hypothetical protein
MAITQKLTKENNTYKCDFNETYFKIDDLFINVPKETVKLGVRGYPTKYSRDNDGIGIYKKVFDINFSDLKVKSFDKTSILAACYEYLKSIDDFKNGTDC